MTLIFKWQGWGYDGCQTPQYGRSFVFYTGSIDREDALC
jgi:hypothetical protein